VKEALQGEINEGLKIRGEHIFTGAAK